MRSLQLITGPDRTAHPLYWLPAEGVSPAPTVDGPGDSLSDVLAPYAPTYRPSVDPTPWSCAPAADAPCDRPRLFRARRPLRRRAA